VSSAAAWGLAAGLGADAALGDPRRGHPVAGFGRTATAVEGRAYRDSRLAGAAYTAGLVGLVAAGGVGAERAVRHRPAGRLVLTAAVTWSVLGGTSLRREAAAMTSLLTAGDLSAARSQLRALCGRDPELLDAAGLARATVESVAENTSDAVVAPLLWGAVAGVPGLVAYRAVNTLDAMVGHRSPRYVRFGWAAARLDDAANLVPARVAAGLAVLLAPVVGGRPVDALRAWRRDAGRHPSPNAGPVEAAFAGALRRTLGGTLAYGGRVEERPLLGDGPAPGTGDIDRAARLSLAVSLAAGALAVTVAAAVGAGRGPA
jgi:adenosylcobinamide-phosphate synthase